MPDVLNQYGAEVGECHIEPLEWNLSRSCVALLYTIGESFQSGYMSLLWPLWPRLLDIKKLPASSEWVPLCFSAHKDLCLILSLHSCSCKTEEIWAASLQSASVGISVKWRANQDLSNKAPLKKRSQDKVLYIFSFFFFQSFSTQSFIITRV